MENIVLIAIIAAVASLLGAILSFIAVLYNGRKNAKTLESIERLKNEFALSNRSRDILDSELKLTLQSLKESIQTIQNLRNEIQTLRLDKEIAIKSGVFERIRDSAKLVMDSYSNSQTSFSEIEKVVFHDAKNKAMKCKMLAEKALQNLKAKKIDVESLNRFYDEFEILQSELLFCQRIIFDYRSEMMLGLFQGSILYINDKEKQKKNNLVG